MSAKPLKPQKSNKKKRYHWLVMPQAYLANALYTAQEICPRSNFLSQSDLSGTECSLFNKLGFRSGHSNYELIWPIIFNFKQGIELWLKGLSNINIHSKYGSSHDLKVLFEFIITEAKKQKKKAKSKEAKNKHKQNYDTLLDLCSTTWPIIERYYYGTYDPKRSDKKHPDKQNERERFPERLKQKKSGGGAYQVREPYEWVNYQVISKIISDIQAIEKHFATAERKIK